MSDFRDEQWVACFGPFTEEYFYATTCLGMWSDANKKKMCLPRSGDQSDDK